jgi:2,4-dienoyl-CoA reductase-like NADH-dependent reductase (Old Yellow Enzyme family)
MNMQMLENGYPNLFSPVQLGNKTIKNRICFSPHGTGMAVDGKISDYHIHYHGTRAAAGVGMIVMESNSIHASCSHPRWLTLADDKCIPGLTRLANAVKPHGCRILAQAIHPGRAAPASNNGSRGVVWDASGLFEERYHQTPAAMPGRMAAELVDAFASGAQRLMKSDFDGMEISAAFGYLISQFLNPRSNTRTDVYGGSLIDRSKLLLDILKAIRSEVGTEFILGLRMSVEEHDPDGLVASEVMEVCELLDQTRYLDYISLAEGGGASPRGWIKTVPPSPNTPDKVLDFSRRLRQRVSTPIIGTSRINTPQLAEEALNSGAVDMVGMVRSLIADPFFVKKAAAGDADDIRACVACNQACINHRALGARISCIQTPETGNEGAFGIKLPTVKAGLVYVVGGGPAGMKAAAVAAERGHETHLYEASDRLGGQVLLAQSVPGREEFGGVIDNLRKEIDKTGVQVHLRSTVTAEMLIQRRPDLSIIATGATAPNLDFGVGVICPSEVIKGRVRLGNSVLVADQRCDWVAPALSTMLARQGHAVKLYVNGISLGENIPVHLRDTFIGDLFRRGIEPRTYMRFLAFEERTAYFEHMITGEYVEVADVDNVVAAKPFVSDGLWRELSGTGLNVTAVGDCVSPRTVEEAILEGLQAGFYAECGSSWLHLGLENVFAATAQPELASILTGHQG